MQCNYKNIYFTTLAIDKFVNIFEDFPETNFIIIDSLNNLVSRKIVKIYAFVIMRNHIHIVWQILDKNSVNQVINSFKKFTGRQISIYLKEANKEYHNLFTSKRKDRSYKIWKSTKGNIHIHNLEMLNIKVRYIHNNPINGEFKSVEYCTEFNFSSAKAYAKQYSNFKFLTVLEEIAPWS